jgi:hypothetical protein
MNKQPAVNDVVALLADIPGKRLARGQVGTVVDVLDRETAMIEFSDDEGRAFAIAPVKTATLLVLHYIPEVA